MKLAQRLQARYQAMRQDCVIVAACDDKHMPYLVNALLSMQARFADHPQVVVHDIGMSWMNRAELSRFAGVTVQPVPPFVAHWRLNWSWKLHALMRAPSRYVLYLDLANFVFLRSLSHWFLAIQRNGYLFMGNGQRLGDITPPEYWALHGLDAAEFAGLETFGAGIIGFDRESSAFRAIRTAYASMLQGLNLGHSADEPNRKYQPDIIRDCACFRADQTLLNLAFRQAFGTALLIRRIARYGGRGGSKDRLGQYLWYARQQPASLQFVFSRPLPRAAVALCNRAIWYTQVVAVQTWRSARLSLLRS